MVDAANPDTPGAANRVLEILRAMMFRTKEWGWRKLDTNPCLGIRKNPRRKIARSATRRSSDGCGSTTFATILAP